MFFAWNSWYSRLNWYFWWSEIMCLYSFIFLSICFFKDTIPYSLYFDIPYLFHMDLCSSINTLPSHATLRAFLTCCYIVAHAKQLFLIFHSKELCLQALCIETNIHLVLFGGMMPCADKIHSRQGFTNCVHVTCTQTALRLCRRNSSV